MNSILPVTFLVAFTALLPAQAPNRPPTSSAPNVPAPIPADVKLTAEQTKKLTFKQGDVLKMTPEDFKDVDVVTLYLLPRVNNLLKPVLLKGLKPGARVVSHDFNMCDPEHPAEDWKEDKKEEKKAEPKADEKADEKAAETAEAPAAEATDAEKSES